MASLQTGYKQSKGYFVVIVSGQVTAYSYTGGQGAGGLFVPGTMTALSPQPNLLNGSILKDMGKTVVVGPVANGSGAAAIDAVPVAGQNQRIFRKVQLLYQDTSVGPIAGGIGGLNNGVFYIELPNLQAGGNATNLAGVTYVPAMPGM